MAGELAVLQKLRSVSNMNPTGDNYFDKRKQQIVGGEDALAPAPLEQLQTQLELGDQGIGVSRDQISDSGISLLRRKLGLQAIQHQQEMEKETQPEIIKGEYGVRAQEAGAKALADRLKFNSDATSARQEDNQAAIMARLDKTIGAQGARQEDAQQYKTDHTPAPAVNPALYSAVQKAQTGYGGMLSKITRGLGGDGGRQALTAALTAVLDKKGTLPHMGGVADVLKQAPGATIDERIVNAGIPGLQQLDPYERQYLALTLGL
jgi:hypothetical protein